MGVPLSLATTMYRGPPVGGDTTTGENWMITPDTRTTGLLDGQMGGPSRRLVDGGWSTAKTATYQPRRPSEPIAHQQTSSKADWQGYLHRHHLEQEISRTKLPLTPPNHTDATYCA